MMINDIFTVNFFHSIIRMTTPILFAGMAAVIGAKADILCIAYEAMMLFSALGGVIISAYTQSLILGMLAGILSGLIIAAIFAYFVLYLGTPPLIAGLALNTLGTAGTTFLVFLITGRKLDTSVLQSLTFPSLEIPGIKDIPVLGPLLSGHNVLSYLAFISVLLVFIFIYKTKMGVQIRAVGENPEAAVSVGIDVKKTKLKALLMSGVIVSFGGMYLSMAQMPYFITNITAGRGFIGIAAQNLSVGSPVGTAVASIIFGAAMALGNLAQTYRLPSQFASVLPYLLTIIGSTVVGYRNLKARKSIKKAD